MKRANSRPVDRALDELVRRLKARHLLMLAGAGLWTGGLPEMRRDRPRRVRRSIV